MLPGGVPVGWLVQADQRVFCSFLSIWQDCRKLPHRRKLARARRTATG